MRIKYLIVSTLDASSTVTHSKKKLRVNNLSSAIWTSVSDNHKTEPYPALPVFWLYSVSGRWIAFFFLGEGKSSNRFCAIIFETLEFIKTLFGFLHCHLSLSL